MENSFGTVENPFGRVENPFGTVENPFRTVENPFGTVESSFGTDENPSSEEEPYGDAARIEAVLSKVTMVVLYHNSTPLSSKLTDFPNFLFLAVPGFGKGSAFAPMDDVWE